MLIACKGMPTATATPLAPVTKQFRLGDVQSGERVRIFNGHRSMILSLAMSPDGRHMASADERWHNHDVGPRKWPLAFDRPQFMCMVICLQLYCKIMGCNYNHKGRKDRRKQKWKYKQI